MASSEDQVDFMAHAVDVSNAEAPAGFRLLATSCLSIVFGPCQLLCALQVQLVLH